MKLKTNMEVVTQALSKIEIIGNSAMLKSQGTQRGENHGDRSPKRAPFYPREQREEEDEEDLADLVPCTFLHQHWPS